MNENAHNAGGQSADKAAVEGRPASTCSLLPRPSYSTGEGPICPFCQAEYTADDPIYYDESGFEEECGECGNTIRVEPHVTVAWTTLAIRRAND